jgi:hypothetical protein
VCRGCHWCQATRVPRPLSAAPLSGSGAAVGDVGAASAPPQPPRAAAAAARAAHTRCCCERRGARSSSPERGRTWLRRRRCCGRRSARAAASSVRRLPGPPSATESLTTRSQTMLPRRCGRVRPRTLHGSCQSSLPALVTATWGSWRRHCARRSGAGWATTAAPWPFPRQGRCLAVMVAILRSCSGSAGACWRWRASRGWFGASLAMRGAETQSAQHETSRDRSLPTQQL